MQEARVKVICMFIIESRLPAPPIWSLSGKQVMGLPQGRVVQDKVLRTLGTIVQWVGFPCLKAGWGMMAKGSSRREIDPDGNDAPWPMRESFRQPCGRSVTPHGQKNVSRRCGPQR